MGRISVFLLIILLALGCDQDNSQTEDGPISVLWSCNSVDATAGSSVISITIDNLGVDDLSGSDWSIYFSQLLGFEVLDSTIGLQHAVITGDYHRLYPTDEFKGISNGRSLTFEVRYGGFAGRSSYAPKGMYFVGADGEPQLVDLTLSFPCYKTETLAGPIAQDLTKRFEDNAQLRNTEAPQGGIIPRPVSYQIFNQQIINRGTIGIAYPLELEFEAQTLQQTVAQATTGDVTLVPDGTSAHFVLDIDASLGAESYTIDASDGIFTITGGDAAGVYYGVVSMARLIPEDSYLNPGNELKIQSARVEDSPRFPYRGLHLDVSRNFHSLDHVKKVIDQLAIYKVNKLLITLTNDEGWRIEIPGIPELIEVGSRRGHTTDESDMLYPAYGSGPFPDAENSVGSGFYTRAEYIDLLKYAKARHIEIIPEIDFPGHARAAIKAMQVRYDKYMAEGDEAKALEYLLHDFDDKSEYRSPQNYSDNVICLCQESSYDFVEKVLEEVIAMYREADAPITAIHSGGDEVPVGAWQKSPVCAKWIAENPEVDGAENLHAYFMTRFIEMLEKHNLSAGGWEEIVLASDDEGHNTTAINFDFVGADVRAYVWNSVWGWGREDMAYKLANGGYKIVMCNSGSLYFDLAYERDPDEPGLTWSGFVDTKGPFDFEPFDMFATATVNMRGEPLDEEYIASRTRLEPSARKNIMGIQAQLWSETVTDSDKLDYYLFPKLIALAERAWSTAPSWTEPEQKTTRLVAQGNDWSTFTNIVGYKELPLLDRMGEEGVQYRISPPGAIYENGVLRANTRYPNLEIRYTVDGSEPTIESPALSGAVEVQAAEIKLKAFNGKGRGSRTVSVRQE